jgi:hypothetical protein
LLWKLLTARLVCFAPACHVEHFGSAGVTSLQTLQDIVYDCVDIELLVNRLSERAADTRKLLAEEKSKKARAALLWQLLLGWAHCSAVDKASLHESARALLLTATPSQLGEFYTPGWLGFPHPIGSGLGHTLSSKELHQLFRKRAEISRLEEELHLLDADKRRGLAYYLARRNALDTFLAHQQEASANDATASSAQRQLDAGICDVVMWHHKRVDVLVRKFQSLVDGIPLTPADSDGLDELDADEEQADDF